MPKHFILHLSAAGLFLLAALLPSCRKYDVHHNPDGHIQISAKDTLSVHGGDTVTVYGKHLPADLSVFGITLNGRGLKVVNASADSFQVVVPKMAGSGRVVVTAKGITINGPYVIYNYVATVTTIAGNGTAGSDNGPALSSSFKSPWGITADANGDLYIADTYNRLLRKYTAATATVSQIDIPFSVSFYSPYNIALDRVTHNLYVTDFNDHLVKVNPDNNFTLIYNDSMPNAGIAVGPDGYLYMGNNSYGTITRLDTNGNNRSRYANIPLPRNLFFDKDGNLYVSAYGIYKVTPGGVQSQVYFDPAFQGWEVARDTLGNFYEADHFNNSLRMIEASTGNMFVIAGSGDAQDVDGVGPGASFNGPQGICIDDNGVLYMTTFNYDTNGGNRVRKIVVQ